MLSGTLLAFMDWNWVKTGERTGGHLHARKFHPRHPTRKTRLAHLLEHFLHLRILPEQVINFLHGGAGAAGNAFAAAAVDGLVMVALVSSHGIDDGLDPVDLFFVNLVGGFLQTGKRADAGQHADKTLQRSHFTYLPQLVAEIFQRKAIAAEGFSGKLASFLPVD